MKHKTPLAALCVWTSLALGGCSGIPGFFQPVPDEFAIRTAPPLTTPTDLFLRPPRTGEADAEPLPTAADVLYGAEKGSGARSGLSPGERELLRQLKTDRRIKNIRGLIDREVRQIERLGERITRALVSDSPARTSSPDATPKKIPAPG